MHAFVDVGYEKDAFLHYLDLGPQFNSLEKFVKQTLSDKKKLNSISKATLLPDLDKDGTVANTLKVGQEVVVQIVMSLSLPRGLRLDVRNFVCRTLFILIPLMIRFPFRKRLNRARTCPPEITVDEHQTEKLRCDCPHSGRRQTRGRTRRESLKS